LLLVHFRLLNKYMYDISQKNRKYHALQIKIILKSVICSLSFFSASLLHDCTV
jgi:hypothetical protein